MERESYDGGQLAAYAVLLIRNISTTYGTESSPKFLILVVYELEGRASLFPSRTLR